MICKNCGTEFFEGIFCPECGTKYEEDTTGNIEKVSMTEKEQSLADNIDDSIVSTEVVSHETIETKEVDTDLSSANVLSNSEKSVISTDSLVPAGSAEGVKTKHSDLSRIVFAIIGIIFLVGIICDIVIPSDSGKKNTAKNVEEVNEDSISGDVNDNMTREINDNNGIDMSSHSVVVNSFMDNYISGNLSEDLLYVEEGGEVYKSIQEELNYLDSFIDGMVSDPKAREMMRENRKWIDDAYAQLYKMRARSYEIVNCEERNNQAIYKIRISRIVVDDDIDIFEESLSLTILSHLVDEKYEKIANKKGEDIAVATVFKDYGKEFSEAAIKAFENHSTYEDAATELTLNRENDKWIITSVRPMSIEELNSYEKIEQEVQNNHYVQNSNPEWLVAKLVAYYCTTYNYYNVAGEIDNESDDVITIRLYDTNSNSTSSTLGFYDYYKNTGEWKDSITGEVVDVEVESYAEIEHEGNPLGEVYVIVDAPDGYVNLRSGEGTEYDVICEIPNGTSLEVQQGNIEYDKWIRVMFNDGRLGSAGYVAASQVKRGKYLTCEGYIIKYIDNGRLDKTVFERYSNDELRLIRNEVFARHGRTFKDEQLQQYFNSQSWYTPFYSPEEFDSNMETILNEYEKYNINVIKEIEAERKN